MKRNIFAIIICVFFAVSCNQDPIFFIISTETAPLDPLIEGAPTNMVVFERNGTPVMYVASGRLHWYAKSAETIIDEEGPEWNLEEYEIPQPGGRVISLATTSEPNRLYALCLDGHGVNATLRYIEQDSNEWTAIQNEAGDYPLIQSIYAAPDQGQLFAGARRNSVNTATYGILYLDNETDTLKLLKSEVAIFSGAAYKDGIYYLSTKGDGIFSVSETDFARIDQLDNSSNPDNKRLLFMSIIKLEDQTIIAVERNGGTLYEVNDGSYEQMKYSGSDRNGEAIATGRFATGAIALWEDRLDSGNKMLIVGIQGSLYSTATSSYTHGYIEFSLNADGSFNMATVRRESNQLLSVSDTDRYASGLGKHPINHLFQTPYSIDEERTFFASTQTAGLWSYRNRAEGGWQWNAEE
ncbi:MAG: hypothetical protein LBI06_02015 [Treponema sp.]|jgi:hypothetical protein|nr:hypothetical protein [Treponema sp.]